jgi:hypothetical protein
VPPRPPTAGEPAIVSVADAREEVHGFHVDMNVDVSFFTDTVPSRPHLNKFIAMADNGSRLQSLDSHNGRLQSLDRYDSHDQLEEDALPPGWKVSKDQNGNLYYYNKELKVTQWSRPEELKVTQWSRPGQSTLENSLHWSTV